MLKNIFYGRLCSADHNTHKHQDSFIYFLYWIRHKFTLNTAAGNINRKTRGR